MTIRPSRVPARWLVTALAAGLGLVFAANARGNDAERKKVFARVNPAVVQVKQEHSLGSGFVIYVDGDSAIAGTNYHVVEGAKKITIFFPATDRDMKEALRSGRIYRHSAGERFGSRPFQTQGKESHSAAVR